MFTEEKMNKEHGTPSEMNMTLVKEPLLSSGQFSHAELPPLLKQIYGGDYFFVPRMVSSSYVVSKEGIYSVKGYGPEVIAQSSRADAFSLALERVMADAIVVTSGTLNAEPETTGWGYQTVFGYSHMKNLQSVCKAMGDLRSSLGKSEYPPVYFMTNSGEVNSNALILSKGNSPVYVVTNERRKEEKFPSGNLGRAKVLVFGDEVLDTSAFVQSLFQNNTFVRYEGGRKGLEVFLVNGLLGQLTITKMPVSPTVPLQNTEVGYIFKAGNFTLEEKIFSKRISEKGEEITSLDLRGVTEI